MFQKSRVALTIVTGIASRAVARVVVGAGHATPPPPIPPPVTSGFAFWCRVLLSWSSHWLFLSLLMGVAAYLVVRPSYADGEDQMEYARLETLLGRTKHSSSIASDDTLELASSSSNPHNKKRKNANQEEVETLEEDDDMVVVEKDGEVKEGASKVSSSSQNASAKPSKADLSLNLPVMSFNIRYDGEEYDQSNHFTQRLPRIKSLFDRINPWIVGIQEGLNGQVVHILSELNPHYKSVIYNSKDGAIQESFVAILYDSSMLSLQDNEYVWMSETPHEPYSKSWSTRTHRMLNMARFRLKPSAIAALLREKMGSNSGQSEADLATFEKQLQQLDILSFNTHLDVWSEAARRAQSAFIGKRIQSWKSRFPNSLVVLTGDFNTAVGQRAYLHLTEEKYAKQNEYNTLKDAWVESPSTSSGIYHSFHGWQGTRLNNLFVRAVSVLGFTLYGMQMELPRFIPRTFSDWKGVVWNIFKTGPQFGIRESMPKFPYNRMHVDWVLYQEPKAATATDEAATSEPGTQAVSSTEGLSAAAPSEKLLKVRPIQASLLDVRSKNFSSDHYPLVIVFQIKPE